MLKINPADSEIQYQQVRELFAELSAWDASQVSQLGLDGQEALDFYYASVKGDVTGCIRAAERPYVPGYPHG